MSWSAGVIFFIYLRVLLLCVHEGWLELVLSRQRKFPDSKSVLNSHPLSNILPDVSVRCVY